MENDDGNLTLTIKEARVEDTGKYTCKIEEFGKEGDDETTCDVTIEGTEQIKNKAIFAFIEFK